MLGEKTINKRMKNLGIPTLPTGYEDVKPKKTIPKEKSRPLREPPKKTPDWRGRNPLPSNRMGQRGRRPKS